MLRKGGTQFSNGGIRDIRVVTGHRANELIPVIDSLGVQTIVNANFSEGMFSSITAGIKSLNPEVTGFLSLTCR